MSKVNLILSSVSENLLRSWCFVALLLSVTLDRIFPASGLDCWTRFTAEFQHLLLPSTLFICPSLEPLWGAACLLLTCLHSQHIQGNVLQCVFIIPDVLRDCIPEADQRMNLEVQKLKASANPAVATIVPYCCTIVWAELFIIFISVKNSNNWTVYRICSTGLPNLAQPWVFSPKILS